MNARKIREGTRITLPATLHEASQTPMGRGPEFLSYNIKQQDRKASIV